MIIVNKIIITIVIIIKRIIIKIIRIITNNNI